MSRRATFFRLLAGTLVVFLAAWSSEKPSERQALPALVLWAWERPEDLRFLDPSTTGVAYLAGTIRLENDAAVAVPRRQPLAFPQGTAVLTVVRSTRYGCQYAGDGLTDFGEVSREAFQTLHRRYPDSPWAERTRYWFR